MRLGLLYRCSNCIELVLNEPDQYGITEVKFHFGWRNNAQNIREDIVSDAVTMLEKNGVQQIEGFNDSSVGGEGIHEVGTERMEMSLGDSVLNNSNQAHDVPSPFVTYDSCMTCSSCVNHSLTYMA